MPGRTRSRASRSRPTGASSSRPRPRPPGRASSTGRWSRTRRSPAIRPSPPRPSCPRRRRARETWCPANDADASILSYGEELNQSSDDDGCRLRRVLGGRDPCGQPVPRWDPGTATLTLDVTLNPTMVIDHDPLAWILVQAVKGHWLSSEPFRLEGATIYPAFALTVGATRYDRTSTSWCRSPTSSSHVKTGPPPPVRPEPVR